MEQSDDKKRREPPGGSDEPASGGGGGRPTKRLLTASDSNATQPSSGGSTTPLVLSTASSSSLTGNESRDQNLLLFQNRAMMIRLEEQRNEVKDKEYRIKQLSHKLQGFEDTLHSVCRVWDQLNSGLNLISGRLDLEPSFDCLLPKYITDTEDSSDKGCNHPFIQSYNFLTTFISEPQVLDENYTIEHLHQNRVKKTQSVFSRIANSVEKEHLALFSLFRLLKSSKDIQSADIERELIDENDRLSQQNQILHCSRDRVLQQIKQLSDQTSYYADQASSYDLEIKDLRQELDRTADELSYDRERLAKLQSMAVSNSLKLSSPTLTSSTANGQQQQPSAGNVVRNSELSLQIQASEEYQELQRQVEARFNEGRKLREEKAALMNELQQIQMEFRNISDERVLNSMPYQILRARLQVMLEDLEFKNGLFAKTQHEIQQLTIARKVDREQIETFEQMRRQGLERRVVQLESEATNLKLEKERLINIIDQRSSTAPGQEYLTESRTLLDNKDTEIQRLKDMVANLKQEIDTFGEAKTEVLHAEQDVQKEIETKNHEIKELFDRLREFTRSNDELKQSERRLAEKEKELSLSVELLKSSSSEQADVIDLLILERKLSAELDELKQQFSQSEQLQQQHQTEVGQTTDKYDGMIKELEQSIEQNKALQISQKQEIEALASEIDSMATEYQQQQEQNTRLIKQISDKEDTHAHLMVENIKSQQTIRLSKETQSMLEDKIQRGEDRFKFQTEVMAKIEEKSQMLHKQLQKVNDDLVSCNFELEKQNRKARESTEYATELRTQWDKLGVMNAELKKKADDSIFALEREVDKSRRLDEEKHLLKKKLDKLNLNVQAPSSTAEEELRLINQRLRCSICNDRQKNYVIAKCFHVFCKELIPIGYWSLVGDNTYVRV
ncbi:hypothetical protein SAMD00019534_004100 [Acytostelium subglobosum LB1]|uniref:hypothetical protein n=1 Tax=Acytostelium subglobosum LB1 TaxID=1410327 RepID=UPI000644F7C0|nr:hypothetical protein SAMD00019534_004100 [Acytostelium subglobosum LB1]GAM17235.1 hypothetical protein SAMD00019534_004100 [Acytostelium subglobosum LB1]|eukprot:XP_012759297.1 hypothetical protein SAMD00019534_004100 [Acytostelium subglobosum LB1]